MLRLVFLISCLVTGFLTAEEPGGETPTRDEIRKQIGAVRTELSQLPADSNPEQIERLKGLETACQHHLNALDLLEQNNRDLANARKEESSWNGFPEPGPYPIFLSDDIRETISSLENAKAAVSAQIRILTTDIENSREKLTKQQQEERKLREEAESANPEKRSANPLEEAELVHISAQTTEQQIASLENRLKCRRTEWSIHESRKTLALTKKKALAGHIEFTKTQLDEVLARINREKNDALQQQKNSNTPPNPFTLWKIEFLDLEKSFWETRFAGFHSKNRATTDKALETLRELESNVEDWIKIAQIRLSGGTNDLTAVDPVQLRDGILKLRRIEHQIQYALEDLSPERNGMPVLNILRDRLLALWDTELYLAEEISIIDGKKEATYRAITLGKLIRLACILTVGWWLLRIISRKIKKLILSKGNIQQNTADLAAKWATAAGLFLLVLYGMNTVRIPLTALAFLGGALAIGVGFGTQTLLKNFISGIILLFERPLKVGDVIEVAGITGTIKTVGIRASVIQHFDGIETLVPNSVLLENQLTNWTFSNTVIRHSIQVGVAYGSHTRDVARLLLAVAHEHGLVKKDPAPEVRFENFADNSLAFSLLFWFDTSKTNRGTLASDLRFMIDRSFAEAGIIISYPQRDIHFDPETPLRVEISRTDKTHNETKP